MSYPDRSALQHLVRFKQKGESAANLRKIPDYQIDFFYPSGKHFAGGTENGNIHPPRLELQAGIIALPA